MALETGIEAITEKDMERIHAASLEIFAETGIQLHHEEALEICKEQGVKVEGNTVYFSEEIIEEALELCPDKFTWQARNEEQSVVVGGDKCLIQPNLGPVYIQDIDNGRREATLEDYANIQKLCQSSDVVDLVGSIPVNPSDVDGKEQYLLMMYETLKNSDKPVIGHVAHRQQVKQTLDLVEIAMGGKGVLEDNHCVGVAINPLSPLGYAEDALETILEYAERNQIVFFASCIMAGVSGPIDLLGTAVLQNVEILAGIVLTQLINPGCPAVYSIASVAANMKNGSFIGGSPEGTLIDIVNLQMGLDYYNLPTRVLSGITDAKTVDCQAGYESMQNLLVGMLGGPAQSPHIVVQAVGVLDSIMTTSYEKFIIDEEIIKRVKRIQQGVDTSEEALSLDVIKEIGHDGTYLTHPRTLEKYRDRWQPNLSCWDSYDDWKKTGAEDVVIKANQKYKERLENAPDSLIDDELDKELKAYMDQVFTE